MIKTITIGQKINGVAQTSKLMMLSGDKILLVDATTGLPPKKVTTKMVGKDLHIFADGATEPSAILGDYSEFSASSTVQGIAHNGAYYNYIPTDAGVMELSSSPVAPAVAKESSFISSAGWWGLGILALGGGVAAAAGGGGGGGGSSATTTTPTGTTQTAVLVDDVLIGVSYTTSSGLSGKTGSDGSFSFKPGDTVTFKVGNATLGSFTPTVGDLVVTISDLAGNDVTKTENLAKFLQSLDSDTNASTITISTATANSITTAANVQDDPTAGGQVTITVTNPDLGALTDTTAPTATIVLSDYTLNKGETALVTITFSEAISGLTNADLTVENGSITALSTADGGITWTATFTPTANINDTANLITLANASYIDQAGNQGSGTSTAYAINTITDAPTPFALTISDDESAVGNIAGGSITYTFSFAKEVTGFSADDINVTGGTKGTFSGSGSSYTLIVTPTPLLEGNITVSVSAGVATATDGSQNLASSSTQTIDMLAPSILTMALAGDTGIDTTDNVTSNHTMNISSPASGTTWEYSLDSGSTWLSGSGTSFNLTDNTIYAINTIQVRQIDAAGNISPIAKNAEAITVDIKAPILTITDNEDNITANMDGSNADGSTDADGADILYTFKFDEDVTGFDISDITITNGTAKTFNKISAKEYTLGVTPDAGVEGILSVNVANTAYNDTAGNTASASSMTVSTPQAIDMLAPLPIYSATSYDIVDNKIIITMNAPLDEVNTPELSDFTVEINTKIVPVHSIAALGDKVTLIMSESFKDTESIRVIYQDDPTDITHAVQDQSGNDATSFTFFKPDVTPPTLINLFFGNPSLSIGQSSEVTMHFSEEVKDVLITFENGVVTGLAPKADDASTWTATFTANTNIEDLSNTFTVESFHDLNDIANIPNSATDSITYAIDTRAPSLSISDSDPDIALAGAGAILYTFSFTEAVEGFSVADVTVIGGSKATAFSSGVEGDDTYTLLITPNNNFEGNLTVDVAAGSVTDLFGNPSIKADQSIQVVDTKPLPKPSFKLKTDSGSDEFDAITNVSTVEVTVDEKAAKWEYSLNGGSTWRTGNGEGFNLANNATYAADAIQVRQYDDSGNTSAITSNTDTIVVDKTAPRFLSMDVSDYANGNVIITMSEILSSADIAKENFVVWINDIAQSTIDANGVVQQTFGASLDADKIVLTGLSFNNGDSIKVAYSDLSSSDDFLGLKDIAGNNAVGFTQAVSNSDLPTAQITLSDTSLKAGETATVTITFSEAVKNFSNTDITVEGGTLSTLTSSDNIVWTATFTPNANYENNGNAISISGSYSDLSGNIGTSDTVSYDIDTLAPTITITDNESATIANNAGGSILYTFTFSEAVSGFTVNDITVVGGTKAATFTSGANGDSVYTLEITPNPNHEGNITVDVSAGSASDIALATGNGNSAATQSIQAVDMKNPTLSITDDESAQTANIASGNITYTFSFSETVVGFTADDVTVSGGTKGLFSGSGSTYTLVITPLAGFEGDITVEVAPQADAAGNPSTLITSTQHVDTKAPTAPSIVLDDDTGLDITDNITSNTTMNVSSIETGATWEYSLDNGSIWRAGNGNSFDLANNTSYAINAIQVRQTDAAGNISSIGTNAETITIDTKGPKLTITDNEPNVTANMDGSNADGTSDADGAEILYTFTFDEAVFDFDFSDIHLTHGAYGTFTKVSNTIYTLGVTPEAGYEGNMSLSVATSDYHDAAGNQGNVTSDTSSIQKVDMLAPKFVSAQSDSATDSITLTYDSILDTVNMSNVKNFSIEVTTSAGITTQYIDGGVPELGVLNIGMADDGLHVTLTLGGIDIVATDTVRIAYSDITTDLTPAIQDLAGNDATSLLGWQTTAVI